MLHLCRSCGKAAPLLFQVGDINRRLSAEIFNWYACPDCKLFFIDPIPRDISSYYPAGYYPVPVTAKDLEKELPGELYKIEMLRRFSPGKRLLEIGPAYGRFCYAAKKAGFTVEALEMDQECCRFISEQLGIPVINSADITQGLAGSGQYDVITLWHVIEHLLNPFEILPVIEQHLAPGGLLVIAAPNPEAFQFGILGRYWPHVDAPRHLALIPQRLLVEHCAKLGLAREMATTTDVGGKVWNRFGWEAFAANLVQNRILKKVLRRIGTLTAFIMSPFDMQDGRGAAYTIVFRKGA